MNRRAGQPPVVAGADVFLHNAFMTAVYSHSSNLPTTGGIGAEVDFQAIQAKHGSRVCAGAKSQTLRVAIRQREAINFPVAIAGARGKGNVFVVGRSGGVTIGRVVGEQLPSFAVKTDLP